MMKLSYMIVLSLFVEFDKINATNSSFYRFLSKLTKTLLYGSTWQKVGAVFVTFCRFLSIFVTYFPSGGTSSWCPRYSDCVGGVWLDHLPGLVASALDDLATTQC